MGISILVKFVSQCVLKIVDDSGARGKCKKLILLQCLRNLTYFRILYKLKSKFQTVINFTVISIIYQNFDIVFEFSNCLSLQLIWTICRVKSKIFKFFDFRLKNIFNIWSWGLEFLASQNVTVPIPCKFHITTLYNSFMTKRNNCNTCIWFQLRWMMWINSN